MRFLYSVLLYALLPWLLLRMLLRSRRAPQYRRRLPERFGRYAENPAPTPAFSAPAIWVHAVSVGEVYASSMLVEALLREYPKQHLVLTTTTPTGSALVGELFGRRVSHVYFPWDLPGPVDRFLTHYRPAVLVLLETELWPNTLAACQRRGCKVLLASARLSAASARGYRCIAPLTRAMVQRLAVIACQSRADANRFIALGANADAVTVTGSLKFDASLGEDDRSAAQALQRTLGLSDRVVWVAGSTHAGEEAILLDVLDELRASHPGLLLLLAPRHPERFDDVARQCESRGIHYLRRSVSAPVDDSHAVLLLDSIGELPHCYAAATVAFVGGSLVAAGGHNPLEAARWSVPVISGEHTDNFAGTYSLLLQVGAARTVKNAQELYATVANLLEDPERCLRMGAAGEAVTATNGGACEQTLGLVRGLLAQP